ncbi:hypothetical protein F4808DRAFT_465803 [Astrocystis sublimbata]|nr:hypothetical protein F4808DRAFT_465803 [Astrocystis sublimbata]
MAQTGRLTLLIQVDSLRSNLQDVPSWVPDWSQETYALVKIPEIPSHHDRVPSIPDFKIIGDGKQLEVQAFMIDRIAKRGTFSIPHTDEQHGTVEEYWTWTKNECPQYPDYLRWLRAYPWHSTIILNLLAIRVLKDLFQYAPENEKTSAVSLLSTFAYGIGVHQNAAESHRKYIWRQIIMTHHGPPGFDVHNEAAPWTRSLKSLGDIDKYPELAFLKETDEYRTIQLIRHDERLLRLHLDLLQYVCYQTIVTLSSGILGFASHSVQPGDLVFVLPGHYLPPMVLRSCQGTNAFQVVAPLRLEVDNYETCWPTKGKRLQNIILC